MLVITAIDDDDDVIIVDESPPTRSSRRQAARSKANKSKGTKVSSPARLPPASKNLQQHQLVLQPGGGQQRQILISNPMSPGQPLILPNTQGLGHYQLVGGTLQPMTAQQLIGIVSIYYSGN